MEVDDDDLRQVGAFTDSGAALGFLKAGGRWSQTKHSRQTRKAINSLVAKRVLKISEFDDPVLVYLKYLSKESNAKGTSARKATTAAARVARDAGTKLATASPEPKRQPVSQPISEPLRNILGTAAPDLRTILNKRKGKK
jgi:hypothetical protein